jgi:hypothetical protein
MPSDVRSALAIASSSTTGTHGETHMCYNYGEICRLRNVYPKPPKERDLGGGWQSEGKGCSREGRRGGGRGDYRTNLMVEEEEDSMSTVEYCLLRGV